MSMSSPWTAPVRRALALSFLMLILAFGPSSVGAWPGGIGFDQDGKGDVALAGCTCHNVDPSGSVTVILDGVPSVYIAGESYDMTIQVIGGAEYHSGGSEYSAGFSMRVTQGILAAGGRPCHGRP